jgi:hypothetical protein
MYEIMGRVIGKVKDNGYLQCLSRFAPAASGIEFFCLGRERTKRVNDSTL